MALPKMSYFRSIFNNEPDMQLDVENIINRIKNDPHIKTLQAQIRAEKDEEEQRKLKEKLPAFTPSAMLATKKKGVPIEEKVLEYSGYLNADFDTFTEEQNPDTVFKKLKKDKFITYVWRSVRNKISALVRVAGGAEAHLENFEMAEAYFMDKYGLKIDPACKNIDRLRYMSYSPEAHHNLYAGTLHYETKEKVKEIKKAYKGDVGVTDLQELVDAVEINKIDLTREYSDWVRIGFGIAAEFGEHGEDVFVRVSQFHPDFDEETTRLKYKSLLQDVDPSRASIKSLFWVAKQNGLTFRPQRTTTTTSEGKAKFWQATNKGLQILLTGLKQFLEDEGFRIYFYDDKNYWLVRNVGGIVERWTTADIRKFVHDYAAQLEGVLAQFCTKDGNIIEYYAKDLCEVIIQRARWSFSEDKLDFLERLPDAFIRPKPNRVIFFFENAFVTINKDGVLFHQYDKLEEFGLIWREQIKPTDINTEFIPDPSQPSMFAQFLMCVCTKPNKPLSECNTRKLQSLRSIIGYLLNPYDKGKQYGIILTDELSDENNDRGRTGKSEIFCKGLAQLANTTFIQSKRTDFNSQFALQKVRISDDLIVFNDLPKGIPLDTFYNFVTDGVDVERKNQDSFEVTAKIIMTMNSLLSGSGDSVKDRFIEFQFTNFFSADFSPVDMFKCWFFSSDWNAYEWNAFFFELFECCSLHFQELHKDFERREKNEKTNYGILRVEDAMLELKHFRSETRLEFVEWATSNVQIGVKYNRAEMLGSLAMAYDFGKLTTQKFTKWMHSYARYMGKEYKVSKSNNVFYFTIR